MRRMIIPPGCNARVNMISAPGQDLMPRHAGLSFCPAYTGCAMCQPLRAAIDTGTKARGHGLRCSRWILTEYNSGGLILQGFQPGEHKR
ncbi:MAG: hypothetical protein BMS9Abin15_0365 [Gammaproteobacteria bacterium]|nr:MAG: hypothetical protein BMS9Abin15_0365 [Gammaproteobacteria bacterium]